MDMWEPYFKARLKHVPGAAVKIVPYHEARWRGRRPSLQARTPQTPCPDASLSREWLSASEISTLWTNYVDIRVSEPLFPSTMGWMVEKICSKKCSRTGS